MKVEQVLTGEDFEEYKREIEKEFYIIEKCKESFIRERKISTSDKILRLQEISNLFFLEEDVEKLRTAEKILDVVRLKKYMEEIL
jgi:hypothetical protein